jgi:hypothetical protein
LWFVEVTFQWVVVHSVENPNARVTIYSREYRARNVLRGRLTLTSAAAEVKVSRQTAAESARENDLEREQRRRAP